MVRFYLFLLTGLMLSCQSRTDVPPSQKNPVHLVSQSSSFEEYWFRGLAELNTYQLVQARYGETHRGHATMIYVTEPFHPKQHVKIDHPNAQTSSVPVMKLNFIRQFNTGLYSYSTMLSSFHPIADRGSKFSYKTSFSFQDWCGNGYMQLRHKDNQSYSYLIHSYFQDEVEQEGLVEDVWLEDGLWNMLRLDPTLLPQGEISLMPSSFFLRMDHKKVNAYTASASLTDKEDGTKVYHIIYHSIDRELHITFDSKFPFKVRQWREVTRQRGQQQSTVATLLHSEQIKYWEKNLPEDRQLRARFSLPENCQ